jgi:hypothetical protein
MSYIQGNDRGQAALLPAVIEDYVAADAAVRVIDAFVDGLDVRGLRFGRSVPAAMGRPPYDPRDLLKLYLYGYLNEVRSSRRLERECFLNVEVMWLLRRLAPQGDGTMFGRSAFVYQPEADTYMCPAGHVLARKQAMRRDHLIVYAARDCAGCSLKPRCTTAERRFVSRHLHEDALERMNAHFQADPTLVRRRRCASEHPFGTIKRMTAGGRFLTRGFKKVGGEAALSVLAYNLIRAINIIGATPLCARLA